MYIPLTAKVTADVTVQCGGCLMYNSIVFDCRSRADLSVDLSLTFSVFVSFSVPFGGQVTRTLLASVGFCFLFWETGFVSIVNNNERYTSVCGLPAALLAK